jgi:hypothetical protein
MAMSPSNAAMFGAGIGGLGANLFGNNNAFDDYENYMNQGQDKIGEYTKEAQGYLDPYRQSGEFGINNYERMAGEFDDPNFYNNIAKNYQMSDGAQFRMKNGMDAVRNAAYASGLGGGSGVEDKALTNYTQGVISQDQNDYIDRMMKAKEAAMNGYGDMFHTGYNAAERSGQYSMDAGQDYASMLSAMAAAKAKQDESRSKGLWGSIGGLVGAGAGWAFGGPAGAAAGASVGSNL